MHHTDCRDARLGGAVTIAATQTQELHQEVAHAYAVVSPGFYDL